jgi:glucan biosynthesis protein C
MLILSGFQMTFDSKKIIMENTLDTRRYDLDWLRFIAIVILLFFHTGMMFNTWDWHVKNTETSSTFTYWMVWSHYFRMPLLLFISGAGTFMALGKRTPGQFAGERIKRLLIPLVFGMFVVVPPQIYYERIKNYDGYWNFYKTVLDFIPYPAGSFSWHHLWFIIYLLVFSLIALPLLNYLRSPKSIVFKEKMRKLLASPAGILLLPSVFILITQVSLRPYFPEETHDFKDWAYFVFYFSFFLFGILCYSDSKLWESIGRNRKHLLMACIFVLIPFYIFFMHFNGVVTLPWNGEIIEGMFDVTAVFVSWFSVIMIISYGQHYLNRPHPWLSKINEGLYPFYILHQTVIIAIGYYICQLSWSVSVKYWVVSLLTLTSCVGFYLLMIRPFNMMRLFFGMKPLKRKEEEVITKNVEVVVQ